MTLACNGCGYAARSDFHKAACLHRYIVVPGGDPMPGATTIAGFGDGGEGLKFGAAKLTAEIAVQESHHREDFDSLDAYQGWLAKEFDVRWKQKADLGTRVHDHALAWSQGKEIDSHFDEDPYLDALERFYADEVVEWIACERIVGSPTHGYGGRADWWAELRSYGPTLGDWKTGARKYSVLKDSLQLTGLNDAEGFVLHDRDGMVADEVEPLPSVNALLNVYLLPSGEYEVYPTPLNDPDLTDAFRALCAGYHARRRAVARLKREGYQL